MPLIRSVALCALSVCLLGAGHEVAAAATPSTSGERGTPVIDTRVHKSMDTTNGPPPAGLHPGARPQSLRTARATVGGAATPAASRASDPSVREVLGFAQSGEISSGAWKADLRFDLVTTVAYFGINVNGDGSLVSSDAGYATWQSQAATDLINAAHAAGDRVVLTVKAFNNATIASVSGSESNRQAAIANIIHQIGARSADGVNVDFEGTNSLVASSFTQFVAELRSALSAQLPNSAYLTVDTYASAASGGTMFDIAHLSQYVDAFDVMAYDITSPGSSHAGPVAPLNGMTYADANTVSAFLSLVPASKVILGVPYYGYKWSVTQPSAQAPTTATATADTYSDVQADLACATQLTQHWDSTFATPWATWWSPATGDPCAGNHNSWRELYFDNAQSLGDKYDLVTSHDLRGVGIWSLGYDSGYPDLWNEIALKLTVPTPILTALPATENTTSFTVSWSMPGSSPAVAYYAVFAKEGGGPWTLWRNVTNSKDVTFFGFKGKQYGFWVEAFTLDWRSSGGPTTPAAVTTVSAGAQSAMPFTSMYALDGYGVVHPASSPPLAPSGSWPGWDIARGLALDSTAEGGVLVDGWGGVHAVGDVGSVIGTGYWPGWDIVRGAAAVPAGSGGWVLDGWGGLHGFAFGSATPPPDPSSYGYWHGWDIARGVAAFSEGSGGVVLDGWGGVHPFTTGSTVAAPATMSGYWHGWDIARAVALIAGSTSAHYSGYVLDGWGGVHPFASQGTPMPSTSLGPRWPGADVARGLVMVPQSSTMGYVVDNEGAFYPFGGAPAVVTPNYGVSGATVHTAVAG
jgi:spore germination protein YaaH